MIIEIKDDLAQRLEALLARNADVLQERSQKLRETDLHQSAEVAAQADDYGDLVTIIRRARREQPDAATQALYSQAMRRVLEELMRS